MTHVSPATESEKTILGAILLDNNVLRGIADKLCSCDFAYKFHQLIFENMINIFNKHHVVDVPMLIDQLKITDEDEAYIYRLANECPSTANVKAHADIIREKSVQRELQKAARSSTSTLERLIASKKIVEIEEEFMPQKEMLASFLEETAQEIRSTDVDALYLVSVLVEITKAVSGSIQVLEHE